MKTPRSETEVRPRRGRASALPAGLFPQVRQVRPRRCAKAFLSGFASLGGSVGLTERICPRGIPEAAAA